MGSAQHEKGDKQEYYFCKVLEGISKRHIEYYQIPD